MPDDNADLTAILDKLAWLTDREWLQREDYYRTRVSFGEHDYATVVLVGADLLDRLLDLWGQIADSLEGLAPDEAGRAAARTLRAADGAVWRLIEEVECRAVAEWSLAEWAAIRNVEDPPVPARLGGDERLAMLRRLPILTHWRLLYAVAWTLRGG